MGRKRRVDERQMELPFQSEVETYCQAAKSILEHAKPALAADAIGTENEIEFNVGAGFGLQGSHKAFGAHREQVLDRANALFGRTGTRADDEAKRPLSLNMFNNYLSKPTETVLPPWLMHAICQVTGDLTPYQWAVAKLDGVIISGEERQEMLLGKLDRNIRAGQRLKRQLELQMRRSDATYTDTEDMAHGKKKNKAKKAQMLAQSANEAQSPVTEPTPTVEETIGAEKAGATTYAELKEAIKQSVKDGYGTDVATVTIDKVLKMAAAEILHGLYEGKSVRIPDLGTFSVSGRKERNGVNPRTGEKIVIPARKAVRFSPAKIMKDQVNG